MKALVIPGVDFSTQRVALPLSNVPPYGRNLKHVLLTSKYDLASGILADTLGGDFIVPSIATALKPTKPTSATFGGKETIGLLREAGNRKCLLGNVNMVSKEITIHTVYTNSSGVAIESDRTLWSFVGPLVNNAQKLIRLSPSGSTAKVRVVTSVTVGAFVPEVSTNVTSVAYETNVAAANSTKMVISLKLNFTNQTVSIYNMGVFVQTVSVPNIVEWTGQMYIGINPVRADNTSDASGLLGGIVMYDEGQSDARILAVANYLSAAFAA